MDNRADDLERSIMGYKVWIQIEECDEEQGEERNATEPMCLGDYSNETQATMLLNKVIDRAYEWNEEEVENVFNRMSALLAESKKKKGQSA